MSDGITIGQAAAYAGVTIKTIRHYHRIGLLPEPERDFSGYRRYRSSDLLRLVTIRTLADCGVPLADVGDLLAKGEGGFSAALAEVERAMDRRIDDLITRRERLRRLSSGDRALLPDSATGVLERMTRLGFDPAFIRAQREGMVLARALAPAFLESYAAQLDRRLDDPEHNALMQEAWEAASWDPEDPRLDDLARRMAAVLVAHPEYLQPLDGTGLTADSDRYELINHHGEDELPAVVALTTLIERHVLEALRARGSQSPHWGSPATGTE